LERRGEVVTAYAAVGDLPFGEPRGRVRLPGLAEEALIGLAVLSHDNQQLTTATFSDWKLEKP
jgi:hypothetical protein